MQIDQLCWRATTGWSARSHDFDADLVLYFGARAALACGDRHRDLADLFPRAHLLGCSTAGQIVGGEVSDDVVAVVAMRFAATRIALVREVVTTPAHSRACGEALGRALAAPDLAAVFMLSDGLAVDGDALVAGIACVVGDKVPVTGGMAGDGPDFVATLVGADQPPAGNVVAAVGFYGSAIRMGHGCAGGWDVFGPVRRITRAEGNVIHEFDGEPALDLYERYLGAEEAKGLPSSALRFPLRLHDPERPYSPVIRGIFGVDRRTRSLTVSAAVSEGWMSQMMRGSFDRLASGAGRAARRAAAGIGEHDGLAISVSCFARRLILGQRIGDEIEEVEAELGPRMARLGFYSYGEIAPHDVSGICELHNMVMAVATLSEEVG